MFPLARSRQGITLFDQPQTWKEFTDSVVQKDQITDDV